MATARKLPSGSWRTQVYSHTEDGKRIYKSFTCDDPSPRGKRKCEAMAADWAARKELITSSSKSFTQAVTDYINARRDTLSPRTIEDYERTNRLYLTPLSKIRTDNVTQADIQKLINSCSKRLSPKTVANIHCLISAVMRQERPEYALHTSLPQRTKPNLTIPEDDDIKRLLESVHGTTLELPIMLAAFGPMREGEICALRMQNIDGNTVHVCENMVRKMVDKKTTWIIRHPKSTEGDRFIDYPDFVAVLWKDKTDRITDMNPNSLCKCFKRLGMPFRFHDLRHYSASIQHALGIPDAYIMQRGGWSSDRVLKAVYRHTLDDQAKQMTERVNSHFFDLMQHEISHEKEKPQ